MKYAVAVFLLFFQLISHATAELTIHNKTEYYLQVGSSEVERGYFEQILPDIVSKSSGKLVAEHDWYLPLWTMMIKTEVYVLDKGSVPRIKCDILIDTAGTTLGTLDFKASCNPTELATVYASRYVHFDKSSLSLANSTLNPILKIDLTMGRGEDIDQSMKLMM